MVSTVTSVEATAPVDVADIRARCANIKAHIPVPAALHDLNQVMRACRTVMALAGGRILATGPTLEVLTPELIGTLYGIDSRVERCSRGCPMMIVDGPARSTERRDEAATAS